MAAYRRVYDSRHLQADCQEPGSAPEPYARQSSVGYLYLFIFFVFITTFLATLIYRVVAVTVVCTVGALVPKIVRYQRGCLCDARQSPCSRVAVAAENFRESGSLMCKTQSADKLNIAYTYVSRPRISLQATYA